MKYNVNKSFSENVKAVYKGLLGCGCLATGLYLVIVFVNIFTREQDIKMHVIFLKDSFQILKESCWIDTRLCHPGTDTLTSVSWPIWALKNLIGEFSGIFPKGLWNAFSTGHTFCLSLYKNKMHISNKKLSEFYSLKKNLYCWTFFRGPFLSLSFYMEMYSSFGNFLST